MTFTLRVLHDPSPGAWRSKSSSGYDNSRLRAIRKYNLPFGNFNDTFALSPRGIYLKLAPPILDISFTSQ